MYFRGDFFHGVCFIPNKRHRCKPKTNKNKIPVIMLVSGKQTLILSDGTKESWQSLLPINLRLQKSENELNLFKEIIILLIFQHILFCVFFLPLSHNERWNVDTDIYAYILVFCCNYATLYNLYLYCLIYSILCVKSSWYFLILFIIWWKIGNGINSKIENLAW